MATPKEQRDARPDATSTGSPPPAGPEGEPPEAAHAAGTYREGIESQRATGGRRDSMEAGMGGTSDAGTAADDAAEAAAFHRGLPDDKTA
ncbi:MAG TPA: hypothetical protein VJU87_03455 [Gemmatimonadaceae bacterium]|nr:hypothetical protein [Gemmatimonadaceae bacterium]